MSSRKHAEDYSLSETVLPDGRTKTTAVYIGGDYLFTADRETVLKARRVSSLLLPVCWLSFAAALLPRSRASHLLYVAVPFACASLPLVLLSSSVWSLLRSKEPLTRETADRISSGLPARALLTFVLSGAAFAGFAVTAVLSARTLFFGDVIFGAASAALTAAAAGVFSLRRGAATHRRG